MTNIPNRRPDCVTEVRMGNAVLTISGDFKRETTDTAADKMAKVLKAESHCQHYTGICSPVCISAISPKLMRQ